MVNSLRTSLAFKQALYAVLAAFAIGLLLSLLEVSWAAVRERAKVADMVRQTLEMAKGSATQAAWNLDSGLARETARSILAMRAVKRVEIRLTGGQPLWAETRKTRMDGSLLSGPAAWLFDDLGHGRLILHSPLGDPHGLGIAELVIEMDPQVVADSFLAYAGTSLLGGMVRNVLLGIALAFVFHQLITRPLIAVGRAVARIDPAQPMEKPLPTPAGHRSDELGYLVSRFNETLMKLHFSQQELRRLATRDPLTDLPNRAYIAERLTQALAQANRHGHKVGVLFLDLDRFKHVNDSLGHGLGDRLLRAVGERLQMSVRTGDTVGRLGGDEFLIIAEPLDNQTEAMRVADRILRSLMRSFELEGHTVHAGTSIGIALYPDDGTDPETLLRNADVAMYAAKAAGAGCFKFFNREMTERAMVRLRTEASLREAVENGRFELFYQPKVEAGSRTVTGVEALIRWHLNGQYVAPGEFIGVAEETGLIVPMGEWVLRTACFRAADWGRRFRPLAMAVNVSARQLAEPGFPAVVRRALADSGLPPALLILEITETVIMRDLASNARALAELRETGVGIAIDDFGTGYSSLSYLRQLPVTVLKVDRSFTAEIPDDPAIAATVLALAQKLNLKTVAEGVESESQLAWLAQEGCDLIQGFLISRPLPEAELEKRFLAGTAVSSAA